MIYKLFLFILLCFVNETVAQQIFLGENGHHWVNHYVVEIKGDTALIENYEFYVTRPNLTEKLVKTNLKDTLFSDGKTKIVSQSGKTWIYWGTHRLKLKDYSQKQEVIALIRESYAQIWIRN
jgi:hypothetical protein